MWSVSAITVHLSSDDDEHDSITWEHDGQKELADFLQIILFQIDTLLTVRNPSPAHPHPIRVHPRVSAANPPAAKKG